jgi:ribosomal protein S18 acetylase RimI-like enzyme
VSVTVRHGRSEDWAFARDLGERTVMASVAAFRQAEEEKVRTAFARLLQIVQEQSHLLLIAQRASRRVGFLLLLDDLPDEVTGTPQGFIAYMAVEPGFRGNAVGRALLAAAEDEARERSLPYMTLMVTEDNAAARALYERSGYVTERRLLCKRL